MFINKRGTAWKGNIRAGRSVNKFFAIGMPLDAVLGLQEVRWKIDRIESRLTSGSSPHFLDRREFVAKTFWTR